MKNLVALALLFVWNAALIGNETVSFTVDGDTFDIEFVEIGSPGNLPDPASNHMRGGVDYTYHISKYEVSREMMEAVGLGEHLHPFDYYASVRGDYPATGMKWNVAAAFADRLNLATDAHAAYRGTIPSITGAQAWYTSELGYDADNPVRNRLARFALPTSDELYKAGFYDPNANDGSGGYWTFATGSNEAPTPVASGTDPGTDVYRQLRGRPPAPVDKAGGLSPFGVMAVGGNAAEWEESAWDGIHDNAFSEPVSVRGGSWRGYERGIMAGERFKTWMGETSSRLGFRVVMLTPAHFELGDVNADGLIDIEDINRLSRAVRGMWVGSEFDLNGDSDVTDLDRQLLLDEILDVSLGDTNLDGAVDFSDFLALSARYGRRGGWESGDADGDGRVTFADFLTLSSNYDASQATTSVPEPRCGYAVLLWLVAIARHRRRHLLRPNAST